MKKILFVLAAALVSFSTFASDITVSEGQEENHKLPINGYYTDVAENHTQFIYSADELANVAGHNISSFTFYAKDESMAWGDARFVVKLAEVEESSLSGFLSPEFTEVFAGELAIVSSLLEINFSTAFAYNGANLLVDISQSAKSSYSDANEPTFIGATVVGAAYGNKVGQYGMAAVVDFLPQLTISHDGESAGTCDKPTKLTATATPDGAVVTWKGAEDVAHQYSVVAHEAEPTEWKDLAANVFTCTVTGLAVETTYDFCLRADCGSKKSDVVRLSFVPVCNAPKNLTVQALDANTATIAWDAVAGISQFQFVCVEEGEVPVWDGVEAKEGLTASLTNLDPSTAYDFYVRSFFSAATQSEAVKISFTTECEAKELPFREAFTGDELPACWEVINHSSNGWQLFTGESDMSGNCIRFNARGNGVTKDTLLLPIVNLSVPAEMKLIVQNISGLTVKLHIIKSNGEIAEVKDFSAKVENPSEEVVDLTAFSGKVTLFFEATQVANRSSYFYLDNLQIKKSENSEAIDNTNAAQTATKQIINGQLYIIRENAIYDPRGTQIR